MEKKYESERGGHYSGVLPDMAVMQPMVVNVSSENVASEQIGEFDSEMGVILQKMDDVNRDYQNISGK